MDFCVSVGAFESEMSIKCLISTSIPISDVGGALYTVDKQLRE